MLALAGCAPTDPAEGDDIRVVVAVVDTSINPYHDFFYANSPIYPDTAPSSVTPGVLEELGITERNRVRLTRSGDFTADVAADAAFWGRVEHGELYWFEGTNIVATSLCTEPSPPLQPQAEKNPHGTGVSASVLKANPEAVVLFVESCGSPDAHEMNFALGHPSVDMMAFSYNVGLPVSEVGAYEAVVKSGKLMFQAAGNYPVPAETMGGPGSWWTIGVSGFDEVANGQVISAALLPDFVASFREDLPFCSDCESEIIPIGGTSISTPIAAGLASRVVLEIRRLLDHRGGIRIDAEQPAALVVAGDRRITNWDLRRALEEAAYVNYTPDDYQMPEPQLDLPPVNAVPINPAAPWLQLAWGNLSTDADKGVFDEALGRLGFGAPTRDKAPGYCDYMAAQMRRRQAQADVRGQLTGELVPADNPYRFCDEE
jgi:hypothetical protein